MFEQPISNPEVNKEAREFGIEDEITPELQAKILSGMESKYEEEYDRLVPRIPESERSLEPVLDEEGKEIAQIEKFRNPMESSIIKDRGPMYQKHDVINHGYADSEDLWMIVDFDDVINNTTTAHLDLLDRFSEFGLDPDKFKALYNEAKKPNAEGKKVLKFDEFIKSIKVAMPGNEQEIDKIVESIDYPSYINQAVKRSLQATHFMSEGRVVRISILTYGDYDYQKMRVDKSGITDVVDDVVYTEGSKAETLEALKNREYFDRPGKNTNLPMILTFDDSPTHIDDYGDNAQEYFYYNIRFNHPQAKRYGKEHQAAGAVILDETEQNKAALNMYYAARMANVPFQIGHGHKHSFEYFRTPDEYKKILGEPQHVYYKLLEKDGVIKRNNLHGGEIFPYEFKEIGNVRDDGDVEITGSPYDLPFEEYILEDENE